MAWLVWPAPVLPDPGRRPLAASLLVMLFLGGCVAPTQDADEPVPLPVLSCVDPCGDEVDRGPRWEPAVSAHPGDPLRIVAASMDQGFDAEGRRHSWPLAHASTDGGMTWVTVRLPMGPDAAPGHPFQAYNHADDPTVLFLGDGTVLYSALVFVFASVGGVGFLMSNPSIALWRSDDGGLSFTAVGLVQAGAGFAFPPVAVEDLELDKQWMAEGPDGAVVMAWNRNERGTEECPDGCTRVFVAASRDIGATWSEPSQVYAGLASGAFPLVLDDGTWVVSYRETNDAAVHVAVSKDEGATWHTNRTIDSTTKFPVLAKTIGPGRSGERIHMVYPQSSETEGQPDVPQTVVLRWSDDGGHTWAAPVVIEASSAQARTIPALAATPEGGAIVTYWHPRGEGPGLEATLKAVAVDPSGRVSLPLALDTHIGHTRTTGDYMGLTALAGGQGAFAVWNAARDGDVHAVTGARLVAS